MSICNVPECDRGAVARGLCRKHYSRQRRGRPLVDDGPQLGSPDGHGLYGILDDDGDRVLCHECGQRYVSLASHLWRAHEMRADEYRAAHGLPRGRGLVSAALAQGMSERALGRVGTEAWRRMEAKRDPAAASAARTPDALRSRPTVRKQRAEGAELLSRSLRGRVATCSNPECGAQWCPLPDTPVRRTCSPGCDLARRQQAAAGPKNPVRDAAIVAAVANGKDPALVGRRYGLGRRRVMQIVRAAQRR